MTVYHTDENGHKYGTPYPIKNRIFMHVFNAEIKHAPMKKDVRKTMRACGDFYI